MGQGGSCCSNRSTYRCAYCDFGSSPEPNTFFYKEKYGGIVDKEEMA
jgi:hypothetical protein